MHAVVARSTFRSKNVQNTGGLDHFWRFRCRFASLHYNRRHYTTLHSTTLHYITLHSTTLQLQQRNYTPLHSPTINYTTLHYTPLTTLHYTTLHYLSGSTWIAQLVGSPGCRGTNFTATTDRFLNQMMVCLSFIHSGSAWLVQQTHVLLATCLDTHVRIWQNTSHNYTEEKAQTCTSKKTKGGWNWNVLTAGELAPGSGWKLKTMIPDPWAFGKFLHTSCILALVCQNILACC